MQHQTEHLRERLGCHVPAFDADADAYAMLLQLLHVNIVLKTIIVTEAHCRYRTAVPRPIPSSVIRFSKHSIVLCEFPLPFAWLFRRRQRFISITFTLQLILYNADDDPEAYYSS